MKWNRYRHFCRFQSKKIVEYDVEVGIFTLVVNQAIQDPNKYHYGVMLGNHYIFQDSPYDTPNEAKKAAVDTLKTLMEITLLHL